MLDTKRFTIDCAKWRCGGDSEYFAARLGGGETLLWNTASGKMCCLGQICLQAGVRGPYLMGVGSPDNLDDDFDKVDFLLDSTLEDLSELARAAIAINDGDLPVMEKISELKNLFAREDITLEFTNTEVIP